MGYKINGRMIYIVVCLMAAAAFIHFIPSAENIEKKESLSSVFTSIDGWKNVRDADMQQEIINALELDDFLFRTYSKDTRFVSLYVGYYHTASKVGAAHSPLVCFPGQGWEITKPKKFSADFLNGKINAEILVVKKGRQHELLLYWYQSHDLTSSGTFLQKIQTFWGRLTSKPEDNAFVRVSVSIQNKNTEKALNTAVEFIQDFYPHFLSYIKV